jgi:cardiolipin synthase A/B
MPPLITLETHPILDSLFEAETDLLTGTVIRAGNSVTLMPSGSTSYAKRWELIEKAESSIHLVSFSMMRDGTSAHLRDLLCEKLRKGVAVRFVLDDAVLYSTFSGGLLSDMIKAGAETVRYHKLFRDLMPDFRQGKPLRQLIRIARHKLKRRFHEKYMVVDGREAILGGINWGDKYAFGGIKPKAWRDTDVHLTGPVVSDIQRQFIKSFFFYKAMDEEYAARSKPGFDREAFYAQARERAAEFISEHGPTFLPELPQTGTEQIRYVPHKPYDEERLPLTEAYLLMFRQAQRYIYWGCHGIRPPRIIAETLADAVGRGVEVRLITNDRRASRTLMGYGVLGLVYWESSNHFRWLIEHGVRVFEWQKPGAFHSKNLVIDDVAASVGSYNIASGSTFHHTESNVIVYGGDFPRAVRRQFEIDMQDCREVPLASAKTVAPQYDPFRRLLDERNFLIDRSLLTEAVKSDLDAGRYKHR